MICGDEMAVSKIYKVREAYRGAYKVRERDKDFNKVKTFATLEEAMQYYESRRDKNYYTEFQIYGAGWETKLSNCCIQFAN